MDSFREPAAIFAAVREEFKTSLPEEVWKEIQAFADVEEVLAKVKEVLQEQLPRPKGWAVMEAISGVANTLQPYFKVVDTFVSSNPEIAALVWGTLRFIFTIADNYTSFLRKVESLFFRIGQTFPDFHAFLNVLNKRRKIKSEGPPLRLSLALAYIYRDLIKLFHRLYKILRRSQKGHIAKLKFLGTISWRSFESLFGELVATLELHSQLFRSHMEAESHVEAIKFYDTWDEKIQHLTSESRTESSSKEIQESLAKPGYGKTTLAAFMIDHLKTAPDRSSEGWSAPTVFYFFDRRSELNSSSDVFKALLSQLIFLRRHDETILDIATIAETQHNTGHQSASDEEVFAILHLFLVHFPNCYLVIDGFDECSDRAEFLKKVERLAMDHPCCRFVLFGRPSVKQRLQLSRRCSFLHLNDTHNMLDIRAFIEPDIIDMLESGDLVIPDNVSTRDIVTTISSKSCGMFLWIKLFMCYLRLPSLTMSQRWNGIKNPEEFRGLDSLFAGIIQAIEAEYPAPARTTIRRAMHWVHVGIRPLHIDELRTAIAQEENRPYDKKDLIPNFEDAIGPMSGSLLEISKDGRVRFIHVTVAEYLESSSRSSAPAFLDEAVFDFKPVVTQRYAVTTCLSYLRDTCPSGPYSGTNISGAGIWSVLNEYPFFKYAVRFWVDHILRFLDSMQGSELMLESLAELCLSFIQDKQLFTSWVEALWHLGYQDDVWNTISTQSFRANTGNDKLAQVYDLLRLGWKEHTDLARVWRSVLTESPEEVWGPSVSGFSDTKLRHVSHEAKVLFLTDSDDPNSIKVRSQVSPSGQAIGLLTVRKYDIAEDEDFQHINSLTNHWGISATYQIRSLVDHASLFKTEIRLPPREVVKAHLGARQEYNQFYLDASISPTLCEVILGNRLLKLATEDGPGLPRFHSTSHKLSELDNFHNRKGSIKLLGPGAEFVAILQERSYMPDFWDLEVFQDVNCKRRPTEPRFVWIDHLDIEMPHATIFNPEVTSRIRPQMQALSRRSPIPSQTSSEAVRSENPVLSHLPLVPPQAYDGELSPPYDLGSVYTYFDSTECLNEGQLGTYYCSDDSDEEIVRAGPFQSGRVHSPLPARNLETQPRRIESLFTPISDTVSTKLTEPAIKFHPCRSEIVYSSSSGMYTWRFRSCTSTKRRAATRPVQIYAEPLRDFDYSMSGHYVCGIDGNDLVVMLNMTQPRSTSKPIKPTGPLEALTASDAPVQKLGNSTRTELSLYSNSEAQSSNTAVLAMDKDGLPVVSILRQCAASSSLVEDVINAQGTMRSQNIMRLPEVLSHNRNLTVLPSVSGNRRVVVGVEPKTSYSFDQADPATAEQLRVPLVFERSISSIKEWSTDLPVPTSTTETLPLRGKRSLESALESDNETSDKQRTKRARNTTSGFEIADQS